MRFQSVPTNNGSALVASVPVSLPVVALGDAVDIQALLARLIRDGDVMPLVQRDLRRGRERPRVAIRVVPPPVQPPLAVDVILVVSVLGHDRVQLRRRRAHVDPRRDGQLRRDVERGVVGDFDVARSAIERTVTTRRRRVRRGSTADSHAVQPVRAIVDDLACSTPSTTVSSKLNEIRSVCASAVAPTNATPHTASAVKRHAQRLGLEQCRSRRSCGYTASVTLACRRRDT